MGKGNQAGPGGEDFLFPLAFHLLADFCPLTPARLTIIEHQLGARHCFSGESAMKKTGKINRSSENKVISDVDRTVKQRKLGNGT